VKDIIETRGLGDGIRAHPFIKGESARPMPRLCATCASAEASCWERRTLRPSPIARPRQRATRGTWSTRPEEAPAGRAAAIAAGMVPVALGPRLGDRCCGRLPIVALPDSRPAMAFSDGGVLPFRRAWTRWGLHAHAADMLGCGGVGHPGPGGGVCAWSARAHS